MHTYTTYRFFAALFILVFSSAVLAQEARLAIVIDDFGYRLHNEKQILALSSNIGIAVLPNSPHAREIAESAQRSGHEILIHLPMAPISKQPLEKDTLHPDMSTEEIARIVRDAMNKVPHAKGLNNHMGSLMTSNLEGMKKVMHALEPYNLYFLDSVTIGNTKSIQAAAGTNIKVIKRQVFLDDAQNEAAIRQQFNRAINLARKNGFALAIGHPHPSTVKVLQQMVPQLPSDIVLVKPSTLIGLTPQKRDSQPPKSRFKPIRECPITLPTGMLTPADIIKTVLSATAGIQTELLLKQNGDFLPARAPQHRESAGTVEPPAPTVPES